MNQTEKSRYKCEWSTIINWKTVEKAVFKLQKRIYRASQDGDMVRVRRLQKLMNASHHVKVMAVKRISQENSGKKTAGVDGKIALTPVARKNLTESLNWDMKTEPIRRVWINKPGKDEKRPLGIPTIRERARQTIIKMAIEPEWEAKFEANSYGFRSGRCCHDAIQAIFQSIKFKQAHVLDADIKGCFDNIDHRSLLNKLSNSSRIKRLIKLWLKAGIMDNGTLESNDSGTPQGSSISPLLANIALHGMENDTLQYLKEDLQKYNRSRWKGVNGKWKSSISIIRYADDFVVLHESEAIVLKAKGFISKWLMEMGLELKPEKTRIAHTLMKYGDNDPGFKFLGFSIRQFKCSDRHKGYKLIIRPEREKVKHHVLKLRNTFNKYKGVKQEELIRIVNPIIRGWSNYYKYVVSRATFETINTTVFRQSWSWACFRHNRRSKKWIKGRYFFKQGGNNWRFGIRAGKSMVEHTDFKIIRFVKVKGNKSPFDGDFKYWSARSGKYSEDLQKADTLMKRQKGRCAKCNLYFLPEDKHQLIQLNCDKKNFRWLNLKLIHEGCFEVLRKSIA